MSLMSRIATILAETTHAPRTNNKTNGKCIQRLIQRQLLVNIMDQILLPYTEIPKLIHNVS